MTRFVLIGGMQHQADKQALGAAILGHLHSPVRFLICLFARNPNVCDWPALFEDNKIFFQALAPEIDMTFELAREDGFDRQVAAADVIYFSGGDGIPLYSAMARVGPEWTAQLGGKTVVGSSAGTDMLSAYSFDPQQAALDRGLGLVRVKAIVHFGAGEGQEPEIGWDEALRQLQNFGEELPVHALREGEFTVITQ